MINRRTLLLAAAPATLLATRPAFAAEARWPGKPIHLIVSFAAGGSADIVARLIGEKLQGLLGQPVIVENKPGANGNIAGEYVARALPDGYTLLLAAAGPVAINPSLYSGMRFDPVADLAPVTLIQNEHQLMAITPSLPVANLREFIAYAKAHPDQLSYGSPGNGSPAHLGGALFCQTIGVKMQHVPYKGSALAINDLIAGQIQLMIDNMPALLPFVRGGKLRGLAVPSPARASAAPELPTTAEAGLPGFVVTAWKGLQAPLKTPRAVIDTIQKAVAVAVTAPDLREKMIGMGAEPAGGTPAQFGELIRADTAKWGAIVRSTGAKVE